jgi:(p)ppGpp synthase/HD superfamily hydrolase
VRTGAAYSPLIDLALEVAARAHAGATRKGTQIPYVAHPFHVALILERHGYPERVVAAGLLHDVLEDTEFPEEELRHLFGEEVLELVKAVSERKQDDEGRERDWKVRKEEQLEHLAGASAEAAALKAADALHNARSLLRDLEAAGRKALERFKRPVELPWYHREVARTVAERLGASHPLAEELAQAVAELEASLG